MKRKIKKNVTAINVAQAWEMHRMVSYLKEKFNKEQINYFKTFLNDAFKLNKQ